MRSDWLSVYEAAERLGVSRVTMESWRKGGTGPRYLKIGGRFWYEQSDLDAFIKASFVEPHQVVSI